MKMDTLGIIGAGNMGKAIMAGVINAGLFDKNHIIVSDVSPLKRSGCWKKRACAMP